MPKNSHYIFAKSGSVDSKYRFVEYMEKGASRPFLVKRLDQEKYYVLKKPLETEQNLYLTILNTDLSSEQKNKELLDPSRATLFYQEKDRFSLEFIRLIASECAPKCHTFFKTEPNVIKKYTGTQFLKNYVDWVKVFNNQQKEFLNNLVITDAAILFNGGPSNNKPIFYIGVCAVLSLVLMIGDMNSMNWGLQDTGSQYIATLIDSGLSFTHDETILNAIRNATDVLKSAFVDKKPSGNNKNPLFWQSQPALPSQLLKAKALHHEVYTTIESLYHLLESGKLFAFINQFFPEFVAFRQPIYRRIRNYIEIIFNNTRDARNINSSNPTSYSLSN